MDYFVIVDMKNEDNDSILYKIKENFQHKNELKDLITKRQSTVVKERHDLLWRDIDNFLAVK